MVGFGQMIGLASTQILEGRREMKADPTLTHPKPVIDDPKSLYSIKKGADFLTGFMYGAGIGSLDEDKVY
jgi:hypothetical protein